MKAEWLAHDGRDKLVVFCNGWGMDSNPVSHINAGSFDILHIYNYLTADIGHRIIETFNNYRERYLICWSMGVWAGQVLFADREQLFSRSIAINGTLLPIDDRFGIPRDIFLGTLRDFSDDILDRFYRRMCKEPGVLQFFLEHRPGRGLADQQAELAALETVANGAAPGLPIYTDIIISGNDLIVPTQSQRAFWGEARIVEIDGCHYPFSRWCCWQDIIDLVS